MKTVLYRSMIYFAHSTMVMYSKDIIVNKEMTIAQFSEANPALTKRVFDECLSVMEYELSHNQIMKACHVYLTSKYSPQSVQETRVYIPKIN